MAFCPDCGEQLSPDASTCPRCGAQIQRTPAGSAGARPAAPSPPPPGTGAFLPPGPAYSQGPAMPPPIPPTGFPPVAAVKKGTSGMAVASLVMGICSFLCLPVLGSILAIILGLVARGQIKRESGRLEGKGLAAAGITLGTLSLVLILAVGIPVGIWVYNFVKQPIDTTNRFMQHIADGEYDQAYSMLHPDSPIRDYSAAEFRMRMKEEFKDLSGWNANGFEARTVGGLTYYVVHVDVKQRSGLSRQRDFSLRKDEGEWHIYDID